MSDRDTKPTDTSLADEPTRGLCAWAIFTPHRQTWLGLLITWACVALIIWLTAVFAKLRS